MRNRQLPSVLGYLRTLVGAEPAGDSIDRELLQRFVAGREEAAFEALMQRHGSMVLGVCRRVLHDVHAAEDAFQATFFVLVRKAASLDRRGSLAGWLYTVAYHLALKARESALRRRLRERPLEDLPAAETSAESIWWELRPILDEELDRLPEKYRAPLVLCYLEGKTNADAAQELGCPCGTVSSRLARGRDLLRARLSRRNLALTPALFATALTQTPVTVVPATLREAACKAAYLFAAGGTIAEGATMPAVGLANAMLRATGMAHVRIAAALLLVVCVVGSATAFLIQRAAPTTPSLLAAGGDSSPGTAAERQEESDPECKVYPRLQEGGTLIASPEAFAPLVKPDCSHCRVEAQRRAAELRDEDRALCWIRGDFDGGVIPLRFFLNTHRVISDKYGVFVYDPDAGYARGFAPSLEFRFHGWRNGIMVMRRQDGTLYSCLSGVAFEGPGKGHRLQPVPTLVGAWGFWLQHYPDTLAYRMDPQFQPVELPATVHKDSCHSRARPDRRLPVSAPVLGVVEGTHARAYPLDLVAAAGVLRDTVEGQRRVLLWDPATRTAVAYRPVASRRTDPAPARPVTIEPAPKGAAAPFIDRETGSHWDIAGRAVDGDLKGWTLDWLDGVQVKWFAWAQELPQTSIFGQ
jgi:RNA polymerase sigma factor (sigma-70 family)